MKTILTRRHNGKCEFGPWLTLESAPEWVGEMIADEIAEGALSGRVDRAGSIWIWKQE